LIDTLQLEETAVAVERHDVPRLQVQWSSRWREFIESIGPAFARSERRLAGEAPFGLIPLRIMVPSYVVEGALILGAVIGYAKIQEMRPYVAPSFSSRDVIYYSGDELPRTEDLGGAEKAATGRAGGDESHHRTQTIKIARGGSLVPRVVDASKLKLPVSGDEVANLLAIQPNPGPPPSEGLRSSRAMPNLPSSVVAPAPSVAHDYTRNGIALNEVIAPAPSVERDRPLTAPNLSASVIPPAPSIQNEHTLIAPRLDPVLIAPAKNISRDNTRAAPSLANGIVAPAPEVSQDKSRNAPALAANVIPPAPASVTRQLSSAPVQMTNVAVVPPPASAPERANARNTKLTLPAPSVIAPPPSTDVTQDMRRLSTGSMPDPSKTVVPPPPTSSGSGSLMSNIIGKIFGPSEVVPPPPAVNPSSTRSNTGTTLTPNVVAPPPSVATSGSPTGNRNGAATSLAANVVAPPATGISGNSRTNSAAPRLGPPAVVPPPPSLAGAGGGTGTIGGGAGSPRGTLLANNIVPPPPSVGGGSASSGSGLGRKGPGLGAPLDAGNSVTPNAGGSGNGPGAVISNQPGTKVGVPTSGGQGSLAMSPTGGDKSGLGGSGGGTGIGHGDGTGSGLNGTGAGAGKNGAGRGADPNANGGISLSPGPGGAGNAAAGNPPVRGVDIQGGSSIVTLPSFGDNPAANDPSIPGHPTAKHSQTLGVTVVATATSGGAFESYKNLLKGERYTTYLDSSLGTVVMEFADESASGHAFGSTLTAPASLRTDLPEGLPHARVVVTCTLDASGNVRNARVLEAGPSDTTAKIVAALRTWKFQPAMRGDQPVAVTAILGFGIDTNDRF
jgi:TonB family protein